MNINSYAIGVLHRAASPIKGVFPNSCKIQKFLICLSVLWHHCQHIWSYQVCCCFFSTFDGLLVSLRVCTTSTYFIYNLLFYYVFYCCLDLPFVHFFPDSFANTCLAAQSIYIYRLMYICTSMHSCGYVQLQGSVHILQFCNLLHYLSWIELLHLCMYKVNDSSFQFMALKMICFMTF